MTPTQNSSSIRMDLPEEKVSTLTDTQKLDLSLQNQQAIQEDLQATQEDLGYLRETINTLGSAMQDLVDKLALQGTPTRPTVNPSAKTEVTGTTQPTPTQQTTPTEFYAIPPPTQQATPVIIKVHTLDDVECSFPKEIMEKLDFSLRDAGTKAWIKPVAFLGSETFHNVNRAILAMGGKYFSDGKNSHFEVPLQKQGT